MIRLIAWFAGHRVAATLFTIGMIAGGYFGLQRLTVEIFPEFSADVVRVSVPYPGAAPEEVEEGIILKIEERVHDLPGIRRVLATAREGSAEVAVQVEPGHDVRRVLDEVRTRVDGIDTFPEDAERPIVEEVLNRRQVIDVVVHGSAGEQGLRHAAERVRDALMELPEISQVDLAGARPWEIAIEIGEAALRRHGLTLDAVAAAVRQHSLDLPAGTLRTVGGEVLLRTRGQAYRGVEFAQVPLLTREDGSRLLLGDVARVVDAFAEVDTGARLDGQDAIIVRVYRVGEQSALAVADATRAWVESHRDAMPEGVALAVINDMSVMLRGRIDLLTSNALQGWLLVFLALALFLRVRLAFWVALGIPVSIMGALWVLPWLGVSINMLSLFAFILVLGILVDDAIVVGENFHHHRERGMPPLAAARRAVSEVAAPVTVAVLTACVAFSPMLGVPGFMGRIWQVIPLVCIACLVFSLFETMTALPSHLAHEGRGLRREGLLGRCLGWFVDGLAIAGRATGLSAALRGVGRGWSSLQRGCDRGLDLLIGRVYRPLLDAALHWRYAALAVFVGILLIAVGWLGSGRMRFILFPAVDSDWVVADLVLPPGATRAQTESALRQMERAALAVQAEANAGGTVNVRHVLTVLGAQPWRNQNRGGAAAPGAGYGEMVLVLAPAEERTLDTPTLERRWRERIGTIAGAQELSFISSVASPGKAVDVQLAGRDLAAVARVAERLKGELARIPGVHSIADDRRSGRPELVLRLRPEAEALGLTQAELAAQLRQAFFGAEAQRIQRGRDEVKVMVRYPEEARRAVATLDGMRIRTRDGREVPFATVAEVTPGAGASVINRSDRERTIAVTSDVDLAVTTGEAVNRQLTAEVLPRVLATEPGVTASREGENKEMAESLVGIGQGFIVAIIAIWGIMAVSFRSFLQPLVIMAAIPFGFIGAMIGHLALGLDFSMMSVLGMVALAGIETNDGIVLVDYINQARRSGVPLRQAVREAGLRRFRPIFLTSLTTFIGLIPVIISGKLSMQAQFLVPMAVSLGAGGVLATVVSLLLVPVLYTALGDLLGDQHAAESEPVDDDAAVAAAR